MKILIPTKENNVIVNKEEYAKEMSSENQKLPDAIYPNPDNIEFKFKAYRTKKVYLGREDSADNYLEIPE